MTWYEEDYKKEVKGLKENIEFAMLSIDLALRILKDYDNKEARMVDEPFDWSRKPVQIYIDAMQDGFTRFKLDLNNIINITKGECIYKSVTKSNEFKFYIKDMMNIRNQTLNEVYAKNITKSNVFTQTFMCIDHILFEIKCFVLNCMEYDDYKMLISDFEEIIPLFNIPINI